VSEGMEKQEGSIHSEGVPEGDRTEEALRRLEEKYRFLFERSPAVNLIIDADGRIRDVSEWFTERLGYSNDEILGRQALEFVVAEQRETVAAVLEMAFRGEHTPEMDVDIYAKDGSVHTIFFSPGQVLLREEGQPTGVLFTGADITERKRAEKALREREKQYRLLIERQREGLTIIDLEEQFVFCNPAGDEIFGVPRGGLVGRNVSEFTTPETFEVIRKQTEKRRSGESSSYEIEITRPDGEKRQLLTTATPWLDKDGRVIGALAIFRDETERKRMEEEIRSLAMFPSENPNPLLRIDKNGILLTTNEASKTLLEKWSFGVGQAAPKFWYDLATEALSTGLSRNVDVEFDGRFYSFFVKPNVEAGYVNLYGREITERKKAEEALRASELKYRALFENIPHGIYQTTPDGKILTANPALVSMLGYDSEAELLAADVARDIYANPEDRSRWTRKLEEEGKLRDVEVVMKRKDGRQLTVLDTGHVVRDEQGTVLYYEGTLTDITERKRAEERWRESEDRFRRLFEDSPVALQEEDASEVKRYIDKLRNSGVTDFRKYFEDHPEVVRDLVEKVKVVRVNRAALELHEAHSEEEFQAGLKAFFTQERYDSFREQLIAIAEGKSRYESEATTARTLTGRKRDISLKWYAAPGYEETLSRMYVSIVDITERRRMEEELRRYSTNLEQLVLERTRKLGESERRFRELAELLPQIVFEIDQEGNLTFINQFGFASTGYSEDDLRGGLNAFQMFVPEEQARAREKIRKLSGGEKVSSDEYTVLRKDGSTFPAIVYAAPITHAGRAVGVRGIVVDITERKRMEEALRASEERFRGIAERSFDAIFTTDQEGRITYMSPAGEKISGYASEEVLGKTFRDFVAESGIPKLAQAITDVRKGEAVTGLEAEMRRKDGSSASVEINALPILRNGEFIGLQGIVRDVTERRRMQEAILKSERLATIGQVAAMVGHDLRNPLTGITGAAYYLKTREHPKLSKKGKEMLRLIEQDIQRSDKIVNDLLEYSRELRLELAETSLKSITRDAVALVKIPRGIRVVESTKNQPTVMVDVEKMKRVFMNIITNAIDAMPEGGTLTIRSRKADGNVEITFTDTGAGMTRDTLEKLWNPLFTTKAKGIGLGLPIAKRLVEAHGGTINARSAAGEGSTFTVTIPTKPNSEEREVKHTR